MANNGRVETGYLKNSKFYVNWQIASTNIEENYDIINWQAGLSNGNQWYNNAVKINSIDINGTRVSNGGTWSNITTKGDIQLLSDSIKIPHNPDGNKTFNISISGWLYSYGNTTGSKNFDLDWIPRQANIIGLPDSFTDESVFYFHYSNPANASMSCWLEVNPNSDHLAERTLSGASGIFTWDLTETERNQIREKLKDSNTGTIRIGLYSTIGGQTFASYHDRPISIINANPIAGTFTYKDTNNTTKTITGNDQRIIRNNSTLQFTIGAATSKKEADISKYQVTIGSTTKEITSPGTINWGTLNLSSNIKATLKVIDTRGNSSTKDITIIIDDWELPTGIITLNRKNNFYSDTYIKVDANYSSINNKNTITIKCRYKKSTNTTYSSYIALEDNIQETLALDNNFAWDVQVLVQDKLGTTTYNLFVDRGTPIIFFDRKRNSVGINGFPEHDTSFEVFGDFFVNGVKKN